jgi:hypothetical protein
LVDKYSRYVNLTLAGCEVGIPQMWFSLPLLRRCLDHEQLGSNSVSCACTALGCRSATLIPMWEVWDASRSRCFVWCLWCLFGAEFNAIYAEGVKQTIEKCEIIEIASIHAVFMHVAENLVGCRKRLGEYPALSPR